MNTVELFAVGLRITYTGDMYNHPGEAIVVGITPPGRWSVFHEVDMILDDGREIKGVSVRGLVPVGQHKPGDRFVAHPGRYADEAEIAGAHAKVAMIKAQAKAKAGEAAAARILEVARLKAEYPYLNAKGDHMSSAEVAKNVRTLLKHKFPGAKFSVRKSDGDAIYVRWTGGPEHEDVDTLARMFKQGTFDGMTDCYEYSLSPFNDAFGGVRYVFCDRDKG